MACDLVVTVDTGGLEYCPFLIAQVHVDVQVLFPHGLYSYSDVLMADVVVVFQCEGGEAFTVGITGFFQETLGLFHIALILFEVLGGCGKVIPFVILDAHGHIGPGRGLTAQTFPPHLLPGFDHEKRTDVTSVPCRSGCGPIIHQVLP